MKPEHIEDYREVETATGANASTSRSGGDRMKNVNFPYVRAASSVATVPQPALNEVIAHSKDQMKSTRKRAAMDMNKIEKAARPDQLVKKQCLGVRDHLALVETTPSTQGGAQIANPEKLGDKQSSSTEVREAEKDVHAGGRSQNKVELDVIVVSGSTPQADEKVSSETQQSKWSAGGECNGEGGENFKLNPEEVKKALSDFYLFDEDLKKFSCSECARFEANEAKMKRHVRIYHASMISNLLNCEICGRFFNGYAPLDSHQEYCKLFRKKEEKGEKKEPKKETKKKAVKDEKNVKVKVIEGAVSKKLGHKNGQKPLKQPARPLRRSARYAGKKKG